MGRRIRRRAAGPARPGRGPGAARGAPLALLVGRGGTRGLKNPSSKVSARPPPHPPRPRVRTMT
ncbi:hypothetical protein SCOCK_120175 [Actinacidiphila cocklensis]|uniref:Uncharacterized protein n=1 Tax=Actinacidiphila cocklensis TaxID=887465 RepID=A0A9W4DJW2_9ACTN|nr:hypothetical protein SCOCK_120175 [Actinacidiphila cocklensis]